MSEPSRFYITTTLPYVNARPHLGHALEMVRADIIARYHLLLGDEVFFNTGTDEHGQKIYEKALEEGLDPQDYVDKRAESFKDLVSDLGMLPDVNFVRTTNSEHQAVAQKFWRRCAEAGDIYKAKYKVLYCVGCELEKSRSDLVNGECPDHPGRALEEREEENYFFRFSRYQQALQELYSNRPDFVIPDFRHKEIASFVSRGLEDFSISRLKSKMSWGVPVPDDPEHVMYVWFDALVNYVSVLNWPEDREMFDNWWPPVQYAGKDNLRQQAAMWQAMLLSAGLEPSRRIVINGFVLGEGGQKMSKTLGNVVDPYDLIEQYGSEALRYYIARELHPFEDSGVSEEKFRETYNANLANGIGNLVSRIMKMSQDHLEQTPAGGDSEPELPDEYHQAMNKFNIQQAADLVWKKMSEMDNRIQAEQPFKTVKTEPQRARRVIAELVQDLKAVTVMLRPIMPSTADSIEQAIKDNRKPQPLFARK